jgi:hypothetical protein
VAVLCSMGNVGIDITLIRNPSLSDTVRSLMSLLHDGKPRPE